MRDSGIFKASVFGGFNRNDVLKYVDELSGKYTKEINNVTKQVKEAEDARSALEEQLYQRDEELAKLRETIAGQDKETDELKKRIVLMHNEITRSKSALRQKELENAILAEKNKQLSYKIENFTFKSYKYDALNEKIGETVSEAKRQAEMMLGYARSYTKTLIEEAKTSVNSAAESLSAFQSDLDSLKKNLGDFCREFSRRIEEAESIISATARHLQYDSEEVTNGIIRNVSSTVTKQQSYMRDSMKKQNEAVKAVYTLEKEAKTAAWEEEIPGNSEEPKFNNDFSVGNYSDFFNFSDDE
ncbi:MAG: hypothetical protein LBC56_07635 [Oscillospiraceae bacterium]|nr:hypothetical protein [Oscillospiraceae bacterium]